MTNKNTSSMSLGEFERLLEIYGGDRTRWPLAARASAAARLSSDVRARRLLAESEAFDAVLLHTAEPAKSDVAALADRIVAAAGKAPRLAAEGRRPGGPVSTAKPAAVATARPKFRVGSEFVRGAALLAASLMIGIFVGQSQFGASALPALEALTGVSAEVSPDRLAMLDLHVDATDDD